MTVLVNSERLAAVRGACNQLLLVILINVPTMSFGLALGWVSLVSSQEGCDGGDGGDGSDGGAGLVLAAATTFGASLLGVPLSALALRLGRKFAVIATSFAFIVCWSLKLVGGRWCVVVARASAGLGAAGAWALSPLLAREMCNARWRGAAASALVPAYNLGMLLMYLAADWGLPQARVVSWCLGLSVAHCFLFMLMPESPAYLAASGKPEAAERSLRWLHGSPKSSAPLREGLAALPPPDLVAVSPFALVKRMLGDRRRLRALLVGGFAVVGQEACGVLALLQYAERVFALALGGGGSAERHAVLLGAAQLAASLGALYLVERLGRKPLIVWSGLATGACLALGAALLPAGPGAGALGAEGAEGPLGTHGLTAAGVALAAAVAADSAGLQPAPYALLADMFHYEYRSCAMMLVGAVACLANLLEVCVYPLAAALGGPRAALALAAAATLAYAACAARVLPETRGLSPDQIYDRLGPRADATLQTVFSIHDGKTESTKL